MKLRFFILFFSIVSTVFLHAEQDTLLEKQMQTLARGTRQLTMQVADPAKQQATITLIESLKKAATDSQGLEPLKTASISAADRAQFLSSFRAQMQKLDGTFSQIEEAVKAAQYDKAKSLLGTLLEIKKKGHSEFKQD